jgi:hypothetical protein
MSSKLNGSYLSIIGSAARLLLPYFLVGMLLIACSHGQSVDPEIAPLDQSTVPLPPGFTRETTEDSTRWNYHYEDLLFEGKPNARFAVVHVGQPDAWATDTALRDTLYHDKRFLIRGNMRHMDLAYRRYESAFSPEQFAVETYNGQLAPPNIASDPNARGFRTMIRRGCTSQGVNFAGHYTVAEWGCGAMCSMLAVVDRIDGRVYFTGIPFDTLDGHYGAVYTPDSRMIVVNSELAAWRPGYRVLWGEQWPSTYVWDEDRKRFDQIETVSDPQ